MSGGDVRLRRFDVAVWRAWPSYKLPVVAIVEATDASAAIVQVMQARGWTWAGHVAANDLEGPLRHRAHEVRLVPATVKQTKQGPQEVLKQLSLIDNLEVMDRNRG